MNDELDQLDAEVARLMGVHQEKTPTGLIRWHHGGDSLDWHWTPPSYTRDPQFALPLIEAELVRAGLSVDGMQWTAWVEGTPDYGQAPTLAIAVCKAVVARGERG